MSQLPVFPPNLTPPTGTPAIKDDPSANQGESAAKNEANEGELTVVKSSPVQTVILEDDGDAWGETGQVKKPKITPGGDEELERHLTIARASTHMMVAVFHLSPAGNIESFVQRRNFPMGLLNETVKEYQERLADLASSKPPVKNK